jgi:hypothetical protein
MRYSRITPASGPASCLHRHNTREDIAEYLATLPYWYNVSVQALQGGGREKCRNPRRGGRTRR